MNLQCYKSNESFPPLHVFLFFVLFFMKHCHVYNFIAQSFGILFQSLIILWLVCHLPPVYPIIVCILDQASLIRIFSDMVGLRATMYWHVKLQDISWLFSF